MSRRKAAAKRTVLPDPLFGSELVARFINVVMRSGKKGVAEKVVYDAFDKILARAQAKEKAPESEEGSAKEKKEKVKKDDSVKAGIRTNEIARRKVLELFEKILEAVQPTVEVKSRRVGGATYQVPVEVRLDRRIALAMRWLVDAATQRNEKSTALRLSNEMLDALEGKGGAIRKREDVHKMAKANQAFAHYRW